MLKVSQLIRAQNWSLLLKDEESGELTFEIVEGINKELFNGLHLRPDEGIAPHVVETGRAVFIALFKIKSSIKNRVGTS